MNGADQFAFGQAIAVYIPLMLLAVTAVAATARRIWGTTLIGAQAWLASCLVAIGGIEIWLAAMAETTLPRAAEPLRYVAVTLTFCPLIALMGAKRPQDRAWHFIVFSLWVVLALPALHVGLLRPGQPMSMPPALAYFMLGMIVMGLLNRLMTRVWLCGLLFAAGQFLLMPAGFPLSSFVPRLDQAYRISAGFGLLSVSTVPMWWVVRRGRPSAEPLDRLWLEFRDLFGVFWALRLAERVNAASALTNSDLVLRWSGFQTAAGGKIKTSLSADAIRVRRQGLQNLLRRFVSRDWIAERLPSPKHSAGAQHETG